MPKSPPVSYQADSGNFADRIMLEVKPNWGASAEVTVGFKSFLRLMGDFHYDWWKLTEEQRQEFKNECQKIVDAPMMKDFEMA